MNTDRWSNLRALGLTLHLLAITLMALPNPGAGLQRSAWRDPTVQQEFSVWRARLGRMGFEMAPQEFEDTLWSFASGFSEVRQLILTPFDPYYRYFGTWQSWRMFVAPHRYPARLHIDVETPDGSWEPIFVARSDEYTWNRAQFDHERFRAATFRYGWPAYRTYYKQFSEWISGRVFAEFPDTNAVRIRYFKYRTLSPAESLRDEKIDGKYISARIIKRESQ